MIKLDNTIIDNRKSTSNGNINYVTNDHDNRKMQTDSMNNVYVHDEKYQ